MKTSRYRAWRFVHPDLDTEENAVGLLISAHGRITMVDEADSVRQSLLLLLSTIPGERVMRPDYGSLLYRLIFSPNDDTTAGLAIHYVRRAVEKWEPRAEILKIDAGRAPENPERLNILLEYRVRGLPQTHEMTFSLNLMREES
jgi:phage baseplate assembly protein W